MEHDPINSPASRNPLDKESFLQGTRQVWCLVFLFCGGIVLFVNIFIGVNFDPTPYMQFLLAISSLFLLGASGDSWVKAYSVKSIKETQVREGTKRMEIEAESENKADPSEPKEEIIVEASKQHADDPSYAPLEWVEDQSKP